jgi:autoinducer 2-degrading protein
MMFAIFVTIEVKPEHVNEFTEATLIEARGTVAGEPGVFQFHMMIGEDRPNVFYFFEVFKDVEAWKTHQETENFKVWRAKVDHMYAKSAVRINMRTVFPSEAGLEKQKAGLTNW